MGFVVSWVLRDAPDTGRIGKERKAPDAAKTEPAPAQTVRNTGQCAAPVADDGTIRRDRHTGFACGGEMPQAPSKAAPPGACAREETQWPRGG